jgi:hypothetical protein
MSLDRKLNGSTLRSRADFITDNVGSSPAYHRTYQKIPSGEDKAFSIGQYQIPKTAPCRSPENRKARWLSISNLPERH